MPWIVGIDEAGYGPNLGPLVMTAVTCRVPQELLGVCFWKLLRRVVRRRPADEDSRLFIEDSKVVYSPARGLGDLETAVLAVLSHWPEEEAFTLSQFLEWLSPTHRPELGNEPWYRGESRLPLSVDRRVLAAAAKRFTRACAKHQLAWGLVRSVIVCPLRFNTLVDLWGSKGAVLAYGLQQLLPCTLEAEEAGEEIHVFIDKHGGRNNYQAILQQALPEGLVVVEEEGMQRSVYRLLGGTGQMRLTIEPRADGSYFCVALASMISKYVRELLMAEFNEFWQQHVPELRRTAGYPGDAARFYKAIRPTVAKLGIAEPALWRQK